MTVFQGAYSDLRFIKTRSVAAITIEIPIETAAAFVAAFGAPTPGSECPVAIARLDPEKVTPEPATPILLDKRKLEEMPLSQQAALRCQDRDFRAFLRATYPDRAPQNAEQATELVRSLCGVTTRADILLGTQTGGRWLLLVSAYEAWFRESGHVA